MKILYTVKLNKLHYTKASSLKEALRNVVVKEFNKAGRLQLNGSVCTNLAVAIRTATELLAKGELDVRLYRHLEAKEVVRELATDSPEVLQMREKFFLMGEPMK